MKVLLSGILALLCLAPAVRGQAFSDNFSHNGVLAPWAVYSGTWSVTGNEMRGGTNTLQSYGYANITNSWANYSVQARVRFQAGAFGGGLGGRLDPVSGAHYAAWVYPENSPGGSNVFKLIKFQDHSTFGYTNSPFVPMAQINLPAVGTNYHTVKLVFAGTQITASFDTNRVINITDVEPQPFTSGTVGLDFYTDQIGYLMNVDDVVVTTAPPSASNDTYNATSGSTLTVPAPGVLGNDTGGNGALSAVVVAAPTHGSFSLNSNGGFTYTATNNYIGSDTFTYRANDGQTNSGIATVTITVGANHAPVANNDSYSLLFNTTLTIGAPGVLANDTDVDGNSLTAALISSTTNGSLTFTTNGGFSYTPNVGFVGSDNFTYRANDGLSNSTAATVSISVLPAALFSDTFSREGPLSPWIAQSGNWAVTGGVLQGGPNPNTTYAVTYITNTWSDYSVQARLRLPAGAFGGGLDGRMNPATGARYSAWIYPETSPGGSNILRLIKFQNYTTFDYNGTGGPIQQVNLASVGTNFHTVKLAFLGNRIAVFFDGNQVISVTDTEAVPYTSGAVAADLWTGDTAYTMSLDDVIVMPLAGNNSYSANEDAIFTVAAPGLLGDDTEVYGTNLTASLVTGVSHGILNLSSNGGFTYLPATNYVGPDGFTYRANDGPTNLGTATVSITVLLVNHPPVFSAQTNRTINELATLVVTNNATDLETAPALLTYQLLSPPAGATIDTNGVISWTPSEAQGPNTFTITTRVTDNGSPAASSTNSFIVTVNELNLAPVLSAQPDRTINELTLLSVTNGATDADLPANTLTYSLLGSPSNAAISASGVITWTPNEAQGPGTYTLTTRVVDNGTPALSDTNSFSVTVINVNSPPILPNQTNRTILALSTIIVNNTATDTDIPGNNLAYTLLGGPTNATISPAGIITWTPASEQDRSTNLFTTVVSDDGSPPLTATNNFIVFVNSDPVVALNATTLAQEGCSTTNNALDPGETVTVLFSLKNTGLGNTTNLLVTLLQTNGVVSPSGPQSYGVLIAGGSAASRAFTFASTGVCGGTVTATLQLQDGSFSLGIASAVFPVGALGVVSTQSFDFVTLPALPSGWTTTASGAQTTWVTTTNPLAGPPANVAFSADAANIGINELVSPPLPLPLGASQLTFKHLYSLEANTLTNTIGWDGGVLEIKIGTNAFTDILNAGGSFVSGPYNRTISTNFGNPLANRQAWSGTNGAYTNTIVNLPPTVAGQIVQFKWRCGTDNGNGGGGWRIHSIAIIGAACCVNSAPVLPTQLNRTIAELATLTVTNTATDDPANSLNYSLVNPPTGAQINANGIITWTPTEDQGPGTNILTTIVTDNAFPALSATNSFSVTVTEANAAPSLPAQSDRTIAELTTLVVTNAASDGDIPSNKLSYALLDPPAGAQIDTNGVITWTPTEAQGPVVTAITTVVTDDGVPPLSTTNSFTVTVTEVNTAPALPPQPNRTIDAQTPLVVTNTATDADLPANTLLYTLSSGPANAAISANGVISWTPLVSQAPSTNTFETVVTDNGIPPLSATNSFVVIVNSPATTNQLLIESISITDGVATVVWSSVTGLVYQLQYNEDIGNTNWAGVIPNVTATGSTASATNAFGGAFQRFYRVMLVP